MKRSERLLHAHKTQANSGQYFMQFFKYKFYAKKFKRAAARHKLRSDIPFEEMLEHI